MLDRKVKWLFYRHSSTIPDEQRINYPKAFVELEEDIIPSIELSNEIKHLCRESLPEYLVPEIVEFVPALPRTDRGKIDYRALERDCK